VVPARPRRRAAHGGDAVAGREFGFVLFGAANLAGVIDRYEFNLAMLGIGVSMTVTPLLLGAADSLVGARSRHEGLAQVDFIGSGRSADDERRGRA